MNKLLLVIFIFVLSVFQLQATVPDSYEITTLNNPAPGYIFLGSTADKGISLYDNYGESAYNKIFSNLAGNFVYFNYQNNKLFFFNTISLSGSAWIILNHNMEIIDSVRSTSQYTTDFHEFQILSNGNYLVLGLEYVTVNMSHLITGGDTAAKVFNYVIQEITPSKQVVFQWSAIDHLNILDATEGIDLTQRVIEPFHLNAFCEDVDGNIIISLRHRDEISKINKTTGKIMWSFGGSKCKNNQFTFTNDTKNGFVGFSHPHDIRRLSNGNLLLFDNGNLRADSNSRVVEYSMNESNKTVTKIWEYSHTPSIYSQAMGNAQRLPNGNTFIGWGGGGGGNGDVVATEVTSDGQVVFELQSSTSDQYRVLRYVFMENSKTLDVSIKALYDFNDQTNKTGVQLDLSSINGNGAVSVEKHDYAARNINFSGTPACSTLPYRWVIYEKGISNITGTIKINLTNLPQIDHKENLSVFRRNKESISDTFSILQTTFNANTNTLEASISDFGEFIIGYSSLFPPSCSLPSDSSYGIVASPTFKWNATTNFSKYRLQLSDDMNFKNIIVDTNNLSSNQVQLKGLNNYTDYFWRIKGLNGLCESNWSDAFLFTTVVAAPKLTFPNNSLKNLPFDGKLQWNSVNGGDQYRVQLSETQDFQNIILDKTVTGATEVDIKNLKSWQTYYWRVSASNQGIWGNWSEIWKFTTMLSKIILSNPANDISGLPVSGKLSWLQLSGATTYNIQIASDSIFNIIDTISSGLKDNFFNYKQLKNLNVYYWRVSAGNNDVNGAWSDTWSFKTIISTPILNSPNNNVKNVSPNPALSWNTTYGATLYQVDVSVYPDFSSEYKSVEVQTNSIKLSSLTFDSTYYWRVRAKDSTNFGEWSEIRKFTVQPANVLVSPNLSYPDDNEFKIPLNTNVSWLEVFNAQKYEIQLSSFNNFKIILLDSTLDNQTEIQFKSPKFNSTYFWRVRAINDKAFSIWSETRSFTTKLETPKQITPSDGDTNMPLNVKIMWVPSFGADYYRIQVSKDNTFYNIISETDNFSGSIYIPDNLVSEQKYYWRISCFNTDNESDWSDTLSFTTSKITDINPVVVETGDILVYPNPANDLINILIIDKNILNFTFIIFNTLGEEIYHNKDVSTIDLNNFSSGNYIYQFFYNNKISNGRFIIWR